VARVALTNVELAPRPMSRCRPRLSNELLIKKGYLECVNENLGSWIIHLIHMDRESRLGMKF
jgi:hypothetical protein